MSELSEFQREVGEWGDKTFNPQNDNWYVFLNGRINHLLREVEELAKARIEDIPEEAADCTKLLLHIAHILEFDLLDKCREKMEINKKRKWSKPDQDGVIEHIREGNENET